MYYVFWFVRLGPSASFGVKNSVCHGWVLWVEKRDRWERASNEDAALIIYCATINNNGVGYGKFLYLMVLPLDLIQQTLTNRGRLGGTWKCQFHLEMNFHWGLHPIPLNTSYLIKTQSRRRWQGSGWKEGPRENYWLTDLHPLLVVMT